MDIFHKQNKKISFYTPLAASLGVINTNDCFYFPFLLNSFTWCSGRKRTTAGLNPWTTDVDLQTGNIGSIPQTCATTNEFDTFFIQPQNKSLQITLSEDNNLIMNFNLNSISLFLISLSFICICTFPLLTVLHVKRTLHVDSHTLLTNTK